MQIIILAVVVFLVYRFFSNASSGEITLIVLGVIGGIVALFVAVNKSAEKDMEKAEQQRNFIREKAEVYKRSLAKKRTQLIVKDDYGDLDDSKWRAEIVLFFNNKIGSIPEDLGMSNAEKVIPADDIAKIIDDVARDGQDVLSDLYSYSENMDGIEYEHFCASLLREGGWQASVSQASNDQGADIIAERDGIEVVIQCKKYSTPVGNKAVQEVSASRFHYGAHYAAVVTNSSFTKSAKQLANSVDVLLLHHSDLKNIDQILECGAVNS